MAKIIRVIIIFMISPLCFSQIENSELNSDLIENKKASLIKAILERQSPNGSWSYNNYNSGSTALHLLALSIAGLKEKHPSIQRGLKYLLSAPPSDDIYSISLFICSLQQINPQKYINEIKKSAEILCNSQVQGTWNYKGTGLGDTSVTQFALLALKASLDAGVSIPQKVLLDSQKHFLATQKNDGGWSYNGKGNSSTAMTAAALSCLAISKLEKEISMELKLGPKYCGSYRRDSRINAGFTWLKNKVESEKNSLYHEAYTAYAVQRANTYYDNKFIGIHDWYKQGAEYICKSNNSADKYTPEAFKLLFLSRGNTPLLLNKVKWGSSNDWNRRRNDIRNLTRKFSASFNKSFNWQSTELDINNPDLGKAPILYISGLQSFSINPNEQKALRAFIQNKGSIIFAPSLNSSKFKQSVSQELAKIFPGHSFQPIPQDHKIRRMHYNLTKSKMPFQIFKSPCVTKNIFITTQDISLELEANKVSNISLASLVNLTKFALNYKTAIKPLTKTKKLEVNSNATQSKNFIHNKGATEEGLDLAQILYGTSPENLDPDPLNNALGFMRNSLNIETQKGINLISLKDLDELKKHPIIYLTGTQSFTLDKIEIKNLKAYLNNGGFLFADAKCSCEDFHQSFINLIKEIYPHNELNPIPLSSTIYQQPFQKDIQFSKILKAKRSPDEPFLLGLNDEQRYKIVYSPIDFSSSLKHQIDDQTLGLKRESALKLIVNIISYGLSY